MLHFVALIIDRYNRSAQSDIRFVVFSRALCVPAVDLKPHPKNSLLSCCFFLIFWYMFQNNTINFRYHLLTGWDKDLALFYLLYFFILAVCSLQFLLKSVCIYITIINSDFVTPLNSTVAPGSIFCGFNQLQTENIHTKIL